MARGISEAQHPGSLALPYVGLVETVEQTVSYGTALTGTLESIADAH
jgi:hypothetical protein